LNSVASQSLLYGRRHGVVLILLLTLSLLDIGFAVLTPWPLKLIVDNVLAGEPLPNAIAWLDSLPGASTANSQLAWLVSSIFVLFFGRQILKLASSYLQAGVMARLKIDLAGDVFSQLQQLSMSFHTGHKAGDLVRRVISDTDFIRVFVAKVFFPAFTALGTLFAMFWIMWKMQPLLSILALIAALPLPFLIRSLTPRMSEQAYAFNAAEGALMAVAEQSITALPVVQAFGRESHEEERFRDVSVHAVRTNLRVMFTELKFSISVGTVTALGTAGMMILGGFQVLETTMTVGTLLVFLSYLASTYGPLETLSDLVAKYATSRGQARRVFEILEFEEEALDESNGRQFVRSEGDRSVALAFENVTFGYEPEQPILKNINLRVPAGNCVALIGATGAGKTTLASLIPRLLDPWEGRVLLDGIDIRNVNLISLREQVGMVLQDSFLLPLTVAENIAYGRPEASIEEIAAAAEAANASEFINRMPQGYDTVIGERGATLSGGQRQRLSIARALLKNSPILILDEPTSALDAETESLILEGLGRLMEHRTTLIIAHRLSTIRNADIIAVLDEGEIVASGSHDELITKNDYYRQFNELQQNPNS
jgi:ABC-type multidrug transport system fused ATPase/permease subunit